MRAKKHLRGAIAGGALAGNVHGRSASGWQPAAAAWWVGMAIAAMAAPAQAQAPQTVAFAIPSQPLAGALRLFSQQAKQQVLFDQATVAGRSAPAVQGSLTPRQALDRMLAGTGIAVVQSQPDAFTLRAAPVDPAQTSTATLETVTVTAEAERSSATEGTGSYTQQGTSSAATGLHLSLRETPQSVSVITRQRMDDFKLETLADVMDQMPGVTVTRQGAAVGFRSRGAELNMSTDGNRQGYVPNNAFYTRSTYYSLDDMAEIDRIEVLKGSAGLTKGDGSYGGTINLVRKKPTRDFQANVSVGAGSWNSHRAQADIGGPLNADGSVRGRVVAAAADSKSFRDFEKGSNQMLYGTLEWDITPDTLLNVGVSYKHREQWGIGGTTAIRYTPSLGLMPRSFNVGASWAGYEQDSLGAFATLEQRLGNEWTAKLSLSHEKMNLPDMKVGYLLYSTPSIEADRFVIKDEYNRIQQASLEITGPFELFGRRHQLMFGAGASRIQNAGAWSSVLENGVTLSGHSYAEGGGIIPFPDGVAVGEPGTPDVTRRRYAYLAGRFSLADRLALIAGARVSDYESLSWNEVRESGVVTPYAGLVFDLTPQLSWYGSYASIFNPQTARDANRRILDPEEGLTYETGLKGEFFDKRLNASLSYFWMKTDNTAESTDEYIPGTTEYAYRAVSGVTRRGYELELSGELAPGWQAQGSYVQNDSSLSSSSLYPKHQFKLGSSYHFGDGALHGLTVGAATRWQSAISGRVDANHLVQRAYWLVDLMARYQVNKQLSVSANVNNLLDKKYFSGILLSNMYTWGAPRSVNVSMRYEF